MFTYRCPLMKPPRPGSMFNTFWTTLGLHRLKWIAVLFLASMGLTPARGQEVVPSTSASPRSGDSEGRPVSVPGNVLDFEGTNAATPPFTGPPAFVPDVPSARVTKGPLDVIHESIFGAAAPEQWQPLSLSTFLSEGWDQPYANPPEGTNQAPKQNWFGSADGVFVRLNSLNFFYTNGMTSNPGLLLTPLPWRPRNRRPAAMSTLHGIAFTCR